MACFALDFDAVAQESQMGRVACAAFALALATLAVKHDNRFGRDFITDRAAGASAGIGFGHGIFPMKYGWTTILPQGQS
jgi:hypothetical protein